MFQEQHNSRLFSSREYLILGLILLTTLIVFLPSLTNDFVLWDDDKYVLENHLVRDLSISKLYEIFTTYLWGNYHPLTVLSLAIEYQFFEANPLIYHITNLFFHLLNTALVFIFIHLLRKKLFISFLVALLFGIHPMHVESVAWISERKDVLYAFFYLASIVSYLQYLKFPDKKNLYLTLTLLCFILGLLSKATTVTVPLVLILLDHYYNRKINFEVFLEKISFFLLSLVFGFIAFHAQQSGGAIDKLYEYSGFERLLIANYGILQYIYKLFVPLNLSIFYPYPAKIDETIPLMYYLAPIVLFPILFLLYKLRSLRKEVIFGGFFALITIILVLQLLPVGDATIADRYTYLPYIGCFYIMGNILDNIFKQPIQFQKQIKLILLSLLLLFTIWLGYVTWNRCYVWQNTETLFTNLIKKYDNIPVAYNNRGNWYRLNGELQLALKDYNKAIEIDPFFFRPFHNRGLLFYMLNRKDLALQNYNLAISYNPQSELTYFLRAKLLFDLRQYKAALSDLNRVIALTQNFDKAFFLRGTILSLINQNENALKDFTQAIKCNPNYYEAYCNMGKVFFKLKNIKSAFGNINKALSINPKFSDAYITRGIIFENIKEYIKALEDYNTAAALDPKNPEIYYNRATSYNYLKEFEKAEKDYLQVISLDSASAKSWHNLGVLKFNKMNYQNALKNFDIAITLDSMYAEAYFSRSYLFSRTKQFGLALKDASRADSLGKQLPQNYIKAIQDSLTIQ